MIQLNEMKIKVQLWSQKIRELVILIGNNNKRLSFVDRFFIVAEKNRD
jgi:hypothetical protein